MTDVVEYELPLGLFGVIAQSLFVRRALDRIFDYRRTAIAEIFAPQTPTDPKV
jgi:ligand-binding SRPBCC domain-containing protein